MAVPEPVCSGKGKSMRQLIRERPVREAAVDAATRVGVDLAKRLLQVHAVDRIGRVLAARSMSRERFGNWCAALPAGCVVAMEACGSAHHWAMRLAPLGLQVRLVAGAFVTPYRMQGKRGDTYVRTLPGQAARSAVQTAHRRHDRLSRWVLALRERRGWQKASVALAHKNARIVWAILTRGERFDPEHVPEPPAAKTSSSRGRVPARVPAAAPAMPGTPAMAG